MAKGLVLGMRCTSVSLRNKWTTLLGKLLRRISTSLHFILHRWPAGPGSPGLGSAERAEKAADIACNALSLLRSPTWNQGRWLVLWKPIFCCLEAGTSAVIAARPILRALLIC